MIKIIQNKKKGRNNQTTNLSLIVWMNFQARSDYPIAIRLSVKSQFVPDRLDEFPSQV
jgi:hypothetical protein